MGRMERLRKRYSVPAKRGMRVKYQHENRFGRITSAYGDRLNILLDGDKRPKRFHPTWMIEYIAKEADRCEQQAKSGRAARFTEYR